MGRQERKLEELQQAGARHSSISLATSQGVLYLEHPEGTVALSGEEGLGLESSRTPSRPCLPSFFQ